MGFAEAATVASCQPLPSALSLAPGHAQAFKPLGLWASGVVI